MQYSTILCYHRKTSTLWYHIVNTTMIYYQVTKRGTVRTSRVPHLFQKYVTFCWIFSSMRISNWNTGEECRADKGQTAHVCEHCSDSDSVFTSRQLCFLSAGMAQSACTWAHPHSQALNLLHQRCGGLSGASTQLCACNYFRGHFLDHVGSSRVVTGDSFVAAACCASLGTSKSPASKGPPCMKEVIFGVIDKNFDSTTSASWYIAGCMSKVWALAAVTSCFFAASHQHSLRLLQDEGWHTDMCEVWLHSLHCKTV